MARRRKIRRVSDDVLRHHRKEAIFRALKATLTAANRLAFVLDELDGPCWQDQATPVRGVEEALADAGRWVARSGRL